MIGEPPRIITPPRTPSTQEQRIVDYVIERMSISEQFDRPFKEKALLHWKQAHNTLPADWPYFTKFYEPETQSAVNDTVEAVMSKVFERDRPWDLRPVEDQDEVQVEVMRELMDWVLREKIKYKAIKYYQFLEACLFGNGIEKHMVRNTTKRLRRRTPMFGGDFLRVIVGMQAIEEQSNETWPASRVISRFDCYPCPTGPTIQEMPYFIERVIMPLEKVLSIGQRAGWLHIDELEGFFSLDAVEGDVRGDWDERFFDLFERFAAIGFDVRSGAAEAAGENAVKYVELLIYSEAPADDEGAEKVCVVADRHFLLTPPDAMDNPFDHQLKSYSEIKFAPRDAQEWQARGICELVEQPQLKINATMSMIGDIAEHVRSPMTFVNTAALADGTDVTDLKAYPGAIVEVQDHTGIRERQYPDVPASLWNLLNYSRSTMQRAGASTDYSKGIAGSTTGLSRGTETASGLSMLMNASMQAKSFRWLLAEETGISQGLNIIASLIQQVLTVPQKIRILGENRILQKAGWKDFLIVQPQDIAGRWDFYAVGASRAMDAAVQGQAVTELLLAGREMPEVAPRIKQLEAWLEIGESKGVRNPRRLLMTDEEFAAKQQEREAQQAGPSPEEQLALIQSIDYRDSPPDVKAQLEQMAGLNPSQFHTLEAAIQQIAEKIRQNQPRPQPRGPANA